MTQSAHRASTAWLDRVLCAMSETGLVAVALWLAAVLPGTTWRLALLAGTGAATEAVARRWGTTTGTRVVTHLVAPLLAVVPLGLVLVVPVDLVAVAAYWSGALTALMLGARRRRTALVAVPAALTALAVATSVSGAGAWSVDEPGPQTKAMVAGNGVVVARDTHAFLVQQAAVILGNDGNTDIASFLASQDPTAPRARGADGHRLAARESYLWRLQLGARDADRVLKARYMPDHFFNWWTHSGKGLIAGASAATWAEQQFAQAVRLWSGGDRSAAMYHLGAATHLVDDACAPPHEAVYVPNHRAYEEWVLPRQGGYAVTSGGIYRSQFRQDTGHGGVEWSSSHTRGWVDECSHRAAELVVNTAQPPPDDPSSGGAYARTVAHFADTQRLTAGYLAFFFETVGGP